MFRTLPNTNIKSNCSFATRVHCCCIEVDYYKTIASIVLYGRMVKPSRHQFIVGKLNIRQHGLISTENVLETKFCTPVPGIDLLCDKVLLAPINRPVFVTRKTILVKLSFSYVISLVSLELESVVNKVLLAPINRRFIGTRTTVWAVFKCSVITPSAVLNFGLIVIKVFLAPVNHPNIATRKTLWHVSKSYSALSLAGNKVFLEPINRSNTITRKSFWVKINCTNTSPGIFVLLILINSWSSVGRTAVQSGGSSHSVRHLSSLISGHQSLRRAISSRSASLHYLYSIYRFLNIKFNLTVSRQIIGLCNIFSSNNFLTVSAIWSTGGGSLVCLSTLLRPRAHKLRSDHG